MVALGRDVASLKVGDRVAAMPIVGCGTCSHCLTGFPAFCNGFRMRTPGAYAEHVLSTAQFCVKLPDSLSMEDGALVEPLAVGLRGVRRSGIQAGDNVLVIGAGPIGLAAVFWARRAGARRIVVTARSRRREALSAALGADAFVVNDGATPLPKAVYAALGTAPDHVFECAGMPGMVEAAIMCVKRRGLVSVLSLCHVQEAFTPVIALVKEVDLRFSVFYELEEFRIAVDALNAGAVEPRAMVTGRIGLDQLPATFDALMQGASHCKVMIDPSPRAA